VDIGLHNSEHTYNIETNGSDPFFKPALKLPILILPPRTVMSPARDLPGPLAHPALSILLPTHAPARKTRYFGSTLLS
jgi:hypothetical protein